MLARVLAIEAEAEVMGEEAMARMRPWRAAQDVAALRAAAYAVIREWRRGPVGYPDVAHDDRMRTFIEHLVARLAASESQEPEGESNDR
jgi:hypothetical protein